MIEGTGYNIIIGFAARSTAKSVKKQLEKEYGYTMSIIKTSMVK